MSLAPKTRVHILSFIGSTFEPCWKEKGTVLKPTARQTPPTSEWSIVRYDNGDTLCIHRSRLMVANDPVRGRVMENLRTHHFNDGDVITGLCPTGEFGAYLDRHDGRVRGYGHTRFAAIADLVESIGHDEPDDFDAQSAAFDHAHDLRKNWEA